MTRADAARRVGVVLLAAATYGAYVAYSAPLGSTEAAAPPAAAVRPTNAPARPYAAAPAASAAPCFCLQTSLPIVEDDAAWEDREELGLEP